MTRASNSLMTIVHSVTPAIRLREARPPQYGQDAAGMYVADLSHKMPIIARGTQTGWCRLTGHEKFASITG